MRATALLICFSLSAHANLIVVNSNQDVTVDDNLCTLREALVAANFDVAYFGCSAGLGDDLIWLMLGTSNESISVNNTFPITEGLEIQGPGADNLVLTPANGHDGHMFQINTTDDVKLQDFRIGGASSSAIDVVNVDVLTIENMRFLSNSAGGSGTYGGAIHADLEVGDTTSISELIISNTESTANSAHAGGAMAVSGEYPVTITDALFHQNSSIIPGGAIYRHNNSRDLFNAHLDITRSLFTENSSNTQGGAISVDLTYLNIEQSGFFDNQGQNVLNVNRSVSNIQNSLFAENPVPRVILHKNITGSAESTELTLAFNTFVDNQNMDLENSSNGADLITYLLGNVFDSDIDVQCSGVGSLSLGYNMERLGASCSSGPNDFFNTDPLLLPLALYGGDRLVAPLSPISPAVDAGSSCGSDDYSGEGRSRDGDASGTAQCDIGAVERPDAVNLNVAHTGNGDGQVNLTEFAMVCYSPDDCDWPLEPGLTYLLEPVADNGSQFIGWGGGCSGTGNCLITMNNAQNVTAEFALVTNPVTLTVNTFRTENYQQATVSSNPAGISCGSTCSFDFEENETVVLMANPQPDTVVDYWDICHEVSVDGLSCTVYLGSVDEQSELYLDTHPDIIFKNIFE